MSRKSRTRRALRSIADKADAALNRLKEALAAMENPATPKISTREQRALWTPEQAYKTAGKHHSITAMEATDIYNHLGGGDFSEATDSSVGMISHGGSFSLMFGPVFKGTLDGKAIGMIDLLAVGEFEYDVRIIGQPEGSENIPDDEFISGLRILKTVKAVKLEDLRTTLDENGIATELTLQTAAQNVIDMCIEHTTKCDCEGCKGIVARAKAEGRPLIELIADDSPIVKMALETVKQGSVSTADKTASESTPEPLSSIVEGIKRAALEGTDVDEQTQERIREAFKRSFVVVPTTETVN